MVMDTVMDTVMDSNLVSFSTLAPVSNGLCFFLEIPNGSTISHNEVSVKLKAYIEKNRLTDPNKKNQIITDYKLRVLIGDIKQINFLLLMLIMAAHFDKPVPETKNKPDPETTKRHTSMYRREQLATIPQDSHPEYGFSKIRLVSDELCLFLGIAVGEMISRVEVTRYITAYVRDNGLQDTNDRHIIIPDDRLKVLLRMADGDRTSFIAIQSLLRCHFPRLPPPRAVTAAYEMTESSTVEN
jgi:chromatin remodeling complex protein RSC6